MEKWGITQPRTPLKASPGKDASLAFTQINIFLQTNNMKKAMSVFYMTKEEVLDLIEDEYVRSKSYDLNFYYHWRHKYDYYKNHYIKQIKYPNTLNISRIKFENNKVFYIETKSCELPKLVDDEETIENLHQDTRKASDKKGSITRIGQSEFRAMIFKQYGSRCVVTGTSTAAVLQAAHIYPYRGNHSHQPWNGLLLRSVVTDLAGGAP